MASQVEETNEEMLAAARFGEFEEMVALLDRGADVNARGPGGNTALHMAAANGEESCLRELLARGGDGWARNDAGNTPAHYAAQQLRHGCLKLLLAVESADVLTQNNFGRSVLTEAMATGNGELASAALEHTSATEERIVEGVAVGGEGGSATHALKFGPRASLEGLSLDERIVKVRELQIAKDAEAPLGSSAADDRTGLGVWASSLVLAQWLVVEAARFAGKTVVELGAGCGAPSLALAAHQESAKVVLTDGNGDALDNARFNVAAFLGLDHIAQLSLSRALADGARLAVSDLDWSRPPEGVGCDVVVGADLVSNPAAATALADVVAVLASEFWYVAPDTGRAGADLLLETLVERHGFKHTKSAAPPDFASNPLVDADDNTFLLYFPDAAASSFELHLFIRDHRV